MKSRIPIYLIAGVIVLIGSALTIQNLIGPIDGQSVIAADEPIDGQIKSISVSPIGNVDEAKPKSSVVSTSISVDHVVDNEENTVLFRTVSELGSADYLSARDSASALANTGYEKLRWSLFQIDKSAIDELLDNVSRLTSVDLLLDSAIQVVPFADDPCTLAALTRPPRVQSGASEMWTIRGRCQESTNRSVKLYISPKDHQLKGKVYRGPRLHYEVSFISDGYALISELDRSKLPQGND